MVGSVECPDPTAALTSRAQLAPFRRTQVAHDLCDTAISVENMLVTRNTKVADLVCVTPPAIPAGSHSTEVTAGEAFWEPGGDVVHYYQMRNLDATGSGIPSARRRAG
jgi:hypothetical protein